MFQNIDMREFFNNVLVWAATEQYHRLGGFSNRNVLQFWRLEIQGHSGGGVCS